MGVIHGERFVEEFDTNGGRGKVTFKDVVSPVLLMLLTMARCMPI